MKLDSALAVAMVDEARRKSGDVSLTIFTACVICSETLTSFSDRFFLFRSGRFVRIQCQRVKESSSRGIIRRRVFLCRRTLSVKVKSKVIPTGFLKTEGRGTFVGTKDWRKMGGYKTEEKTGK